MECAEALKHLAIAEWERRYTLDLNGQRWSHAALDRALQIIEIQLHVRIVGLPRTFTGEILDMDFTLPQTLIQWSEEMLE